MLLTLTTTHRPATDLGFLLHKHPDRVQSFSVPFGTAHVLYPEATEERCTAALVLDVDPVGLVRRGRGAGRFALAEYVNDRPYVASSFLSVALVTVFKSAMAGTCKERPELAATAIALDAALPAVPARGGEDIVRRLFDAARLRGRDRAHPARSRAPRLGNRPAPRAAPAREPAPGRPAQPPLRPAPRARRRQALLGRRGRDREAHPPR